MGKNRKPNPKNANLGRTLIKEKNNARRGIGHVKDSWLHTSEVPDTYSYATLNLRSVTEQSTLENFLETAELAGVEFTAEKLNVKIVGAGTVTGVLGENEKAKLKKLHEENQKFVTIPRRPAWDSSTTPEELELKERDSFLNWRRSLALLQEKHNLLLTPYEKNLDVWRQLWRVIERSDMVCQIVDGRNPLLYKCDDLETYIRETNKEKEYVILVNKADYLDKQQRQYWFDYFTSINTKVIFWSALQETEVSAGKGVLEEIYITDPLTDLSLSDSFNTSLIEDENISKVEVEEQVESKRAETENQNLSESDSTPCDNDNEIHENRTCETESNESNKESYAKKDEAHQCTCPKFTGNHRTEIFNSSNLVPRKALVRYFKTFKRIVDKGDKGDHVTVGLVGYPNVGKSSTINALLQEKKTAVSATPGKTKHFQTHFIDDELCLCDCPGLVFPSFISTKADMVLNGILPIDQLRDHVAPTTILSQRIPRKIIESTYGINIPKPKENEDQIRIPTAEEILSSYAKMRGFMTANGLPDSTRAARYVLKDYVKGKLLYCHPPPGVAEQKFMPCKLSDKAKERMMLREEKQMTGRISESLNKVDEEFFKERAPKVHYRAPTGTSGRQMIVTDANNEETVISKPWKKQNRSKNKNKREKMRRIMDRKNRDSD